MSLRDSEPFLLLSDADVSTLILDLRNNLPHSYTALGFVLSMREWMKTTPSIEAGIYAPNGDFTHSTVLVILKFKVECRLTYYSQSDEGCDRLRDALNTTHIVDRPRLTLMALHDRVHQRIGTDWSPLNLRKVWRCNLYCMAHEEASKLNIICPKDVEIKRLQEVDAELINSHWPYTYNGSLNLLRQVIKSSYCVGIYKKTDDRLESWALLMYHGSIGAVQTLEESRRKGFAETAVKSLIDQLTRDGRPLFAQIIDDNLISMMLFEKLGFKKHFICYDILLF